MDGWMDRLMAGRTDAFFISRSRTHEVIKNNYLIKIIKAVNLFMRSAAF